MRNNLINGQKPEFGNLEHIKWVRRRHEILGGIRPFAKVEWQLRRNDEAFIAWKCPLCERTNEVGVFHHLDSPLQRQRQREEVEATLRENGHECLYLNCVGSFRFDKKLIYLIPDNQ